MSSGRIRSLYLTLRSVALHCRQRAKTTTVTSKMVACIMVLGALGAGGILMIPGEPEAKQAAAGLVAGAGALATFFINKEQKQQHFESEQASEQARFDRQVLEAQF